MRLLAIFSEALPALAPLGLSCLHSGGAPEADLPTRLASASVVLIALLLSVGGIGLAALAFRRRDVSPDGQVSSFGSGNGQRQSARPERQRTLIVGAGYLGKQIAHELEAAGTHEVIGFIDDELVSNGAGRPVLATRADIRQVVGKQAVDEIIIAYAPTWQQQLIEDLVTSHPAIRVRIVPTVYEAMLEPDHLGSLGDIAILDMFPPTAVEPPVWKRCIDVCGAVFGLVLLLPAMGVIAAAIRVTSPGPALFTQERVGIGGRVFHLYKFRTMVRDAEKDTGPTLSTGDDDERLTGLGRRLRKLRLDELPQFWNVLKGDMSLVGPRPERPHFVRQFEQEIPSYDARHAVRPGITGLAQVFGGYRTDPRDKLRFDLLYVRSQSLLLDLRILWRTVGVVLRARGCD